MGLCFEGKDLDAMNELHGWIGLFWEQGMEEPPWFTFQDAAYSESRTSRWDRAGMYQLKHGDYLTILNDDDTVLWAGTLENRRKRWFRTLCVSSSDWHPLEVPPGQWLAWFQQKPPLRAMFRAS